MIVVKLDLTIHIFDKVRIFSVQVNGRHLATEMETKRVRKLSVERRLSVDKDCSDVDPHSQVFGSGHEFIETSREVIKLARSHLYKSV